MPYSKQELIDAAKLLAAEFNSLAHYLRVLILAIIAVKGRVAWADLKSVLESLIGPVNPNTLAFHVRKLIRSGYIEREGGPESVIYLDRIPEDVRRKLDPIIKGIKAYLEGSGG